MELGALVALVLTLMVYCYLGKDIPFLHAIYRIAVYVFVGVALGYGAVMAWHGVLAPRLFLRLGDGEWVYMVPLVLCLLLLLSRISRAAGKGGNLTIAFLFGVGAALAVGGALVGTLIPQTLSTAQSLNPAHYEGQALDEGGYAAYYAISAFLVAFGTISTLAYFTFSGRKGGQRFGATRGRLLQVVASFGRVFIMFTLGALFAVIAISRLSLLVDRSRFILETVLTLVEPLMPG